VWTHDGLSSMVIIVWRVQW